MNENTIETPVPQPEMTAGEMLRNARTTGRRKREIPTIAKLLCIREEFLQALEDGDFSVIPETVYMLGFARNYAMELGLDPDEIVNKLKREMGIIGECGDKDADVESPVDGTSCAMPDAGVKIHLKKAYKYVSRNWKWFASGLTALVVIVVALILLWPSAPNADAAPVNDAVAPVVADANTDPAFTVAVRERFGNDNRAKANVILQATAESWVKVEDGRGNTVFSRVLVPGDVYYVPVGDKHKATFGNAGGIDVWVNGKKAPRQGADHARKSGISLSPKSLMATPKAK